MRLAFLLLLLLPVTASADTVVRWPDGRRVYVVDARNIGPYGQITKPKGIDVVVVRKGNRWGVLPSSAYRSPYRIGN
ncbi:MAG: hypothetical protein WD738_21560 [Pirellulales bacterium]